MDAAAQDEQRVEGPARHPDLEAELDDVFSTNEDTSRPFDVHAQLVDPDFSLRKMNELETAPDDHEDHSSPPTNDSVSTMSPLPPSLSLDSHIHSLPLASDLPSQFSSLALTPRPHHHESHPYPSVVIDASRHSDLSDSDQMPSTSSSLPTTPPPPPLALKPSPDIVSQEPTDDHTAPSPPKQTDSRHRPQRSIGPSALEKVISKTRPAHLPPKARTEDRKHAADWENMMRQSRLAEQKRQHALHERRLAREAEIEASSEIWSKQILPNWSLTLQNPTLRKLWWKGIPPKLRGPLWENAIGNALALSKDSFRVCLARARRSISSGAFPTHTLQLLEGDIVATLPNLRLFHPVVGPLYSDLKDLLLAWTVARSDEGLGYVVGASKVAAMLLLNVTSNERAFVAMRNLLERGCSRAFYGGSSTKDDVEAYYRIFDTLLADGMPKVYFNFKQHQIPPSNYLPGWLLPLFIDHLPFEACARVWDVLILEGDSFLFRAALAIMGVIESRLFFPDRDELLSVLRGEHKAALEVAKRSGLTGNGKYEIYGLNEETLWERIDAMDDWWKESTWIRLTQRELPDL